MFIVGTCKVICLVFIKPNRKNFIKKSGLYFFNNLWSRYLL